MKRGYLLLFLALFSVSFAQESADFPTPYNSEADSTASPMPAEESVKKFQLPEGFEVTVFASEPEVQNPISMSWDHRGRLWVAENYTYARKGVRIASDLRDRVVIFEDTDWDGKADKRTVFTDKVQVLTSVAVGHGGVWLMCSPQLLFIPDANEDDIPDGPPQVMLDGFVLPEGNYHNFANGLKWGPDGWLYGRIGHSCPGKIGAPGTPENERIPVHGGIWRFHPSTHQFEMLTHGTVNPWGHDWDKHGQLFHINTVIGHLWHAIPGAYFRESGGAGPNPFTYSRIDQHADHYHFDTTGRWQESRDGAANSFGGGHAHIGMEIYQADHLPNYWRDKLLTWNLHGRRLNVERLERKGAGYVGRHEPDQFISGDEWFRGIEISTGPDGALYGIDWNDTGECHDHTGVYRTSGRIYRFSHGEPAKPTLQITDLKNIIEHPNVWHFRQKLTRLAARPKQPKTDLSPLISYLEESTNSSENRLRALWTLFVLDPEFAPENYLFDSDEYVQCQAIQLALDSFPIDAIPSRVRSNRSPIFLSDLEDLAEQPDRKLVHLTLSSALQRLPTKDRIPIAKALSRHVYGANDHNLEHMVWFGLIPLVQSNPEGLLAVAQTTEWPQLLNWIARATSHFPELRANLLTLAADSPARRDAILGGMLQAFEGLQRVSPPKNWQEISPRLETHPTHAELAVLFGDGKALKELIAIVESPDAEIGAKTKALETLIAAQPKELKHLCLAALKDRYLASTAVKGLATFDEASLGEQVAKSYKKYLPEHLRQPFIDVLVTRPAWASSLLDQMGNGRIPRHHVTAYHAQQILALNDESLSQKLSSTWGQLQETNAEKQGQIDSWKQRLSAATLAKADLSNGRMLYEQSCSACHQLYGKGSLLGPDLTGSGRSNLDYLLQNIIDPSAKVSAEYQMTTLTLKDGRILSGMISEESQQTLKIRQLADEVAVDQTDILERQTLPQSIMPEGLLTPLTENQVRDLLAYLMHPTQVKKP